MPIKQLENLPELENVLSNNKHVILDCFAQWCGPCKMMKPILEDIGNNNDNVLVVFADVERVEGLKEKYSIRAVPTLISFKNGNEIGRQTGMKTKSDINLMVQGLQP